MLGLFLVGFSLAVIGTKLFQLRYWRDWQDRWLSAPPIVSFFLGSEKFLIWLTGDRGANPPTRVEAFLWFLPALLFSIVLAAIGMWLIVSS